MLGNVYNLPIRGKFHEQAHPHVVTLVIGQECVVTPCFGDGGAEVEESILDEQNRCGLRGHALQVRLDNSTCVAWMNSLGKTGKKSVWLPWRSERISISDLPPNSPGQMLDECMEDILKGMVSLKDQRKNLFSTKAQQLLDTALSDIKSRLAAKRASNKAPHSGSSSLKNSSKNC